MPYDFSRLTVRQQELLTFQGWSVGSAKLFPQPSPRTVKKLIERGLVIEHERVIDYGRYSLAIKEYEVPIDVHMAWCFSCSQGD